MHIKTRVACSLTALFAVLGTPTLSQTVTIQTVDGNVSLQGTLLGFDGENYDFDSAIGRTMIPAAAVVCLGDACPVIEEGLNFNATVAVLDQPSQTLLHGLAESFASGNDLAADVKAETVVFEDADGATSDLKVVARDPKEAFLSLLEGKTQVVFSTAPISDDLAEEFVASGFADLRAPGREVVVALDAIVPVTHPSNNVRDLTLATLAQIAAGRIDNWNELGGPDAPIRMVLPAEDTSIAQVIDTRVMRPNRLRLNRALERVATEADAAAIVANDPTAITLTSAALTENTNALPIREVCGPLSVPTNFAIKAEEYPLARRVLMYTSSQELSEDMKGLLSYAGSEEAQASYIDVGFFGQSVEDVPMSLQGSRLASAILQTETPEVFEATRQLTQTLALADRLSTTFRFEPGSTELDNKSRRDAVRIAEYLTLPENEAREILLFGFTDSIGRDDLNQLLSLQQTISIKDAVISASNGRISEDRITLTSYGSIAPVGCNDTAEGRTSNRRVEVWLR